MIDEFDFNELLVSYLLKELDADKEQFVAERIKKDKQLQQNCFELENLLRLIDTTKNVDEINLEEEQLVFNQNKNKAYVMDAMQEEFVNTPIQALDYHTAYYFHAKRILIAIAVVIFFITVTSLFLRTETRNGLRLQQNRLAVNNIPVKIRHESNMSGKARTIMLNDGTTVTLFDKSVIDFPETFANEKREIHLTGQANFKVAKDKARPFTVYSNDISTTALGTQFTVSNYHNESTIRVQLFEGRVVVKSIDSSSKFLEPYYLFPGQELVYNKTSKEVKINSLKISRRVVQDNTKENKYIDNPSMPSDKEGSWFMFNNESLPRVFDELSQMYGISIKYKNNEVQKIYFIGKFDKSDPLDYILKNIATINSLTLLKEKDGYRIKK